MTIEEATRTLESAPPEYRFVLNTYKPFWNSREVADALGVSAKQMTSWAQTIPGAYPLPAAGYNIPRTSLVIFVAELYLGRARGTA